MKIFTYIIVNKENETDRFNNIIKQIDSYKLNNILDINFFCYCWKNDITKEIRNKYCKSDWTMKKHNRDMKNSPLTNGEISLFLNHIESLRKIRKNYSNGYFLILESDIIFKNLFYENIENVLNDIKNIDSLDILNIGEGVPNHFERLGYPKSKPIIINKNKYYKENINKCTEGILWSYKGICKFLDYFEKDNNIDGPIDTKIDVFSKNICELKEYGNFDEFNIFWCEKPLVQQGSNLKIFNSNLR